MKHTEGGVVDERIEGHDASPSAGAPGPTGERSPDRLADELRALLPLRSRSSVRDRHLPALVELVDPADADQRDRRYAALACLIDGGIDRVVDVSHREAARALLGSGEGRWRTVAQRGAEAASHFGCGWDAYRRRRASGTSQLDDTIAALAEAIIATGSPISPGSTGRGAGASPRATAADTGDRSARNAPAGTDAASGPAGPPQAGPGTAAPVHRAVTARSVSAEAETIPVVINPPRSPDPSTIGAPPAAGRRPSGRRGPILAGLVAASLVVSLVVAIGLLRPQHRSTDATEESTTRPATCAGLAHEVGDVPADATDELKSWSARFREAAREMDDPPACAGFLVEQADTVLQPVSNGLGNGRGLGALVGVEEGGERRVVVLTHSQYFVMRSTLQQFGPTQLGRLVRRNDHGGHLVAEFTNGEIVSESIDGATFAVVGALWREWNDHGGLTGEMGAPVSAAYDDADRGRVQEFAHGDLIASYRDGTLHWSRVDNPADALPDTVDGTILVQPDDTAWYVGEDGVRRWIPDNANFLCATGLGGPRFDDVPGWAVATLPAGPYYLCR